MTLLDEIVDAAVDDTTPLPTILRKCLVLAHTLKNEKLKAWVENELNGYADDTSLPEYRKIGVTAVGAFSGPLDNVINNQPLQASVLPENLRHWAKHANLMQPIAAYDIGKTAEGVANGGRFQWPQDLVAMYAHDFIQGWSLIRAHQPIPGSVFTSLLDTVRTRILQLCLELKGELGESISDVSELSPILVDRSVVNYIYGGNVVIAGNAQNFHQIGSISVQKGNLPELNEALKELGLDEEAIANLKNAMDADAKSNSNEPTLGQRTKKWLTDAATYTSKEGLKVGFEVAKRYATKWLLQHLGLDVG